MGLWSIATLDADLYMVCEPFSPWVPMWVLLVSPRICFLPEFFNEAGVGADSSLEVAAE